MKPENEKTLIFRHKYMVPEPMKDNIIVGGVPAKIIKRIDEE